MNTYVDEKLEELREAYLDIGLMQPTEHYKREVFEVAEKVTRTHTDLLDYINALEEAVPEVTLQRILQDFDLGSTENKEEEE